MARFAGGWIKIHRELKDKDITENVYLFSLWMWLLMAANYKESQIIWNGQQRILKPGQLLYTVRELSKKWDCSTSTNTKWLHYLCDTGRIHVESRTWGTIVTICNWELYQVSEEEGRTPAEHQPNTSRTPAEHQTNNSKERKKERIKEINNKSLVGILTNYPTEFDNFWKIYGRRGDKKKALQVYEKIPLDERPKLAKAIAGYCRDNPELKFRLHFCRFLASDWREYLGSSTSQSQSKFKLLTFDNLSEKRDKCSRCDGTGAYQDETMGVTLCYCRLKSENREDAPGSIC